MAKLCPFQKLTHETLSYILNNMNKKIIFISLGLVGGIILFVIGFFAASYIYQKNHPLLDTVVDTDIINSRLERFDQGIIYYKAIKNSDEKSQKIVINYTDSEGKTTKAIEIAGAAKLLSANWSPNHQNALIAVKEGPFIQDPPDESHLHESLYLIKDLNTPIKLDQYTVSSVFIDDETVVSYFPLRDDGSGGIFSTFSIQNTSKVDNLKYFKGINLSLYPLDKQKVLFIQKPGGLETPSNGLEMLDLQTKTISTYIDDKKVIDLVMADDRSQAILIKREPSYKKSMYLLDNFSYDSYSLVFGANKINLLAKNMLSTRESFSGASIYSFTAEDQNNLDSYSSYDYEKAFHLAQIKPSKSLPQSLNNKTFLNASYPTVYSKYLFYISNDELHRVSNIKL